MREREVLRKGKEGDRRRGRERGRKMNHVLLFLSFSYLTVWCGSSDRLTVMTHDQ